MLIEILIATLIISLISFVGILFSHNSIKKFLHYFISFAAATLIAVSFFDLMPHAIHELEEKGLDFHFSAVFIVAGILIFFLIEKFIHWHHCGSDHCDKKAAGLLILTGDFVHNFFDGLLIAGAFMFNTTTGILTTITVAIHEIPQEFGDFAVLIHSGYKKKKALLMNFLSALSAVLGGILGFLMFDAVKNIAPFAVLITAGGFLYIALTDIVPSMHTHKRSISIIETIIFIATIVIFYFFLGFLHSH